MNFRSARTASRSTGKETLLTMQRDISKNMYSGIKNRKLINYKNKMTKIEKFSIFKIIEIRWILL